MSNKRIKYLLLFVLSFLLLSQKVSAATIGAYHSSNYDMFQNYTYKVNYIKYENEIKNYVRHIKAYTFFTNTNSTYQQVYCIQQKVNLGSGYSTTPVSDKNKQAEYLGCKNSDSKKQESCFALRKELISSIISAGFNVQDSTNATTFKNQLTQNSSYPYVLATQELIWEVVKGDRTTLNPATYAKNITNSINVKYAPRSSCNATVCPFYNLIINSNVSGLSKGSLSKYNTVSVLTAYKEIINAAYNTFYKIPDNFAIQEAQSKSYGMDYVNGQFTKTFSNSKKNYNLFTYTTSNSNVKVESSSSGDKLTITSTTPLTSDVIITATNKNPAKTEDDFKIYHDSKKQDVAVGHRKINYFLKLSTPMYQLKIIKKGKISNDNEEKLAGAVFYVCSKNTCSKSSIIDTITTDKNGEAITKKINKPGTYYIKEKTAPTGYELSSEVTKVSVTSDDVAGSTKFKTVTIIDKAKEFNLEKYTVDENNKRVKLTGDCGTDEGPTFELKDSKGQNVYFKELKNGEYKFVDSKEEGATTKLKTCNGEFKVSALPDCSYVISETKAPTGLQLPKDPNKSINICKEDKSITFTNGFTGLEFQKKNEDGNLVSGGKFALQLKQNNVYKDVALKYASEGNYEYDANATDTTYELETLDGIFMISKLPPGEYRIVEKEAPEGYELIEDKDSKALVTISDSGENSYYLVEMIDQKVSIKGSSSFAELIVTIITGRKVPNYVFILLTLTVLLITFIILRKKIKK